MNNGYGYGDMPPRGKFAGRRPPRMDYDGYDRGYGGSQLSREDITTEGMMRHGKYKDSTGWHNANAGEGTQSVTNLTNTAEGLGSALGRTLGAGVNTLFTGVKKVFKGVGGFFKKLFTGKNPFK